jgi:hypothetical protein
MVGLKEMRETLKKIGPSETEGPRTSHHSRASVEPAAAGMISASLPSISRNCLAVTKADSSAGLFGRENPGDLLHIALAGDSFVIVGTALAHRKWHRRVIGEPTTVNLFL